MFHNQRLKANTPKRTAFRAVLIGAVICFTATGFVVARRNHWPKSVTRAVGDLRVKGIPATLEDLDRRYQALARDEAALRHFNTVFQLLPTAPIPVFESSARRFAASGISWFKQEMLLESGELQKEVREFLERHANVRRMLHDANRFQVCRFPVKLTDGWNASLPHLGMVGKAASLLALEAVYRARTRDTPGSLDSISTCLHLAEILRDDPTSVGIQTQVQVVVTTCQALCASLNITPLPAELLAGFGPRMETLLTREHLHQGLVSDRCFVVSTFFASDRQLARFLSAPAAPDSGLGVVVGIEVMRLTGQLQRDCGFALSHFQRLEGATLKVPYDQIPQALAVLSDEVEANRNLVQTDKRRLNLISDMVLPSTIRICARYFDVLSLTRVTSAALAVEQYRERNGRLPETIAAIAPLLREGAFADPLVVQRLSLRKIDPGYEISENEHAVAASQASRTNETRQIAFRVTR